MRVVAQTIRIRHLTSYTVRIRHARKPDPDMPYAAAWCERDGPLASTIYVRPGVTPFTMAHEIMHVLRNICVDFNMDFTRESEHMAYLMQWLLGKAFGYEWKS